MQPLKFSRSLDRAFVKQLQKRVRQHFKEKDISTHANYSMILKTILMMSMFLIPLIFMITGLVQSVIGVFVLYLISGLGMAGIGMGVMHDAIHGSYSKNQKINKFLGYSMNLIGANAKVWKMQHNVLHHTYTNIHEADDDINMPFFLRFTPHTKKHRIHRFQFLYVWFFYSISTLTWVTLKDFVRLKRYKNMGLMDNEKNFGKEVYNVILWKLAYFTYALALPMIFLPISPWIILLGFLAMHLLTGLIISCVFQVAHIMPEVDYPQSDDEGQMESNWMVHQLQTTTNFATNNRVLSWLIGGLNFQVEHHLFPNICHVHYSAISNIVKTTALEFGIPYHEKPTFSAAIVDHVTMLRRLGR